MYLDIQRLYWMVPKLNRVMPVGLLLYKIISYFNTCATVVLHSDTGLLLLRLDEFNVVLKIVIVLLFSSEKLYFVLKIFQTDITQYVKLSGMF